MFFVAIPYWYSSPSTRSPSGLFLWFFSFDSQRNFSSPTFCSVHIRCRVFPPPYWHLLHCSRALCWSTCLAAVMLAPTPPAISGCLGWRKTRDLQGSLSNWFFCSLTKAVFWELCEHVPFTSAIPGVLCHTDSCNICTSASWICVRFKSSVRVMTWPEVWPASWV